MIEPMTSLAFSVYSGKGVYAVLLGSGVSRTAEIPTGWEITLDLIRKAAHLQKQDCGDDPAVWYAAEFRKEPDYSELLEGAARTSGDRGQVLRPYFEPTEEEREQGKKTPTAAHQAVARLVAGGYVRVVVTTNFDRLMEQALEAEGVRPVVIASADAILGALPLPHAPCTVVKVHGDYLDTRLKNTRSELERYDEGLNGLLARIFDEYGLVVCGWSAEWDVALRAAIERCPNRRFACYWSAYGELAAAAKSLCDFRRAEVVSGRDADSFFGELAEKVESLAEFGANHPLSARVAAASLKRFLPEPRHRIRMHDLVAAESEKAAAAFAKIRDDLLKSYDAPSHALLIPRYDAATEILLSLLIAGGYWGESPLEDLWVKVVERVARHGDPAPHLADRKDVTLYPALLLFYGCGIAAVAAGRYQTVAALARRGTLDYYRKPVRLMIRLRSVEAYQALEPVLKRLPDLSARRMPISDHFATILREPLREYLPGDGEFLHAFDRFEYLTSLVYAEWELQQDRAPERIWGPHGGYMERQSVLEELQKELEDEKRAQGTGTGYRSTLLSSGLLKGTPDELLKLKAAYDKFVGEVARRWGWR